MHVSRLREQCQRAPPVILPSYPILPETDSNSDETTMPPPTAAQRYELYGLSIELTCEVPELQSELTRVLSGFRVASLPARSQPTCGWIKPYSEAEVLRHLSPTARRVTLANETAELYQDGERFWMIDDRW